MKRVVISSLALAVASCVLWMAPAGASVRHKQNVPSVMTCAGKAVIKPNSYVLSCADANSGFQSIKWSSWGTTSAIGTGTFVENTCEPSCVAGKNVSYPVTIAFSVPKKEKVGLLFSVVKYTYRVSVSSTLPLSAL